MVDNQMIFEAVSGDAVKMTDRLLLGFLDVMQQSAGRPQAGFHGVASEPFQALGLELIDQTLFTALDIENIDCQPVDCLGGNHASDLIHHGRRLDISGQQNLPGQNATDLFGYPGIILGLGDPESAGGNIQIRNPEPATVKGQ